MEEQKKEVKFDLDKNEIKTYEIEPGNTLDRKVANSNKPTESNLKLQEITAQLENLQARMDRLMAERQRLEETISLDNSFDSLDSLDSSNSSFVSLGDSSDSTIDDTINQAPVLPQRQSSSSDKVPLSPERQSSLRDTVPLSPQRQSSLRDTVPLSPQRKSSLRDKDLNPIAESNNQQVPQSSKLFKGMNMQAFVTPVLDKEKLDFSNRTSKPREEGKNNDNTTSKTSKRGQGLK